MIPGVGVAGSLTPRQTSFGVSSESASRDDPTVRPLGVLAADENTRTWLTGPELPARSTACMTLSPPHDSSICGEGLPLWRCQSASQPGNCSASHASETFVSLPMPDTPSFRTSIFTFDEVGAAVGVAAAGARLTAASIETAATFASPLLDACSEGLSELDDDEHAIANASPTN